MLCVTDTVRVPSWELHHRLGRSLEVAELSNQEMADYLRVAETTIRNYLSGRTVPRRGTLLAWAWRCDVPLDWLRYGDVPPLPEVVAGPTRKRGVKQAKRGLSCIPDDRDFRPLSYQTAA